jgi:hypothetical protein
MSQDIGSLFEKLKPDDWRKKVGFSDDIVEAQKRLFDPREDAASVLSDWLELNQPCIFGRAAAKLKLIRFCILRESDLTSDAATRDIIQNARLKWIKDAFDGKASAFVILLISPRIAHAVPDGTVRDIAHRLTSLYLRHLEVQFDTVHHERVLLEKPGSEKMTWEWLAGVNYFCAQGDRRWWHDHRIPGGMGLSVNSVGHMAKAGKISDFLGRLNKELGVDISEFGTGKIKSLQDALLYAMLTIDGAASAVSGKATELLPLPTGDEARPVLTCPIKLPPKLSGKSHCTYSGWYHTDQTLPSDYFRPDVARPSDVLRHDDLDFTYLFDDSVDNPAFETMGTGRRIRANGEGGEEAADQKIGRMVPREISIEDSPLLKAALEL